MYSSPVWYDTILNSNCTFGIVDMGRIEVNEIQLMFNDFKDTDGIIFDIRNYPNGTLWEIVNYIYTSDISVAKIAIPDISFPGRLFFVDEHIGSGTNEPYNGKIIILFNEKTISQAEYTIMGLEQHQNAIKIGSTTKAADGNVSYVKIPGRIQLSHTGLGIYYPDYTPTQRVGIIPDYYIRPTIEGIREGRDEILEFALNCSVGLEELNQNYEINIYPNPAIDVLNFEITGSNIVQKSQIQLANLQGQVFINMTVCDFNGSFSTENLPNGIYILSISNEKQSISKKIIIQH